eukprot:CFRG0078T1
MERDREGDILKLASPVIPVKAIDSANKIQEWKDSQSHRTLLSFIGFLGDSVRGLKISDCEAPSKNIESILKLLNILDEWVDRIPPETQPQRFGNRAFKVWAARLEQESAELVKGLLATSSDNNSKVIQYNAEIAVYFTEGFGNATRIDYGTGHELSFMAFLCCLMVVGVVTEKDAQGLVLSVYKKYLQLVRRLQVTYKMEPAGSHGVWGLDDFQFLPYYFGASQLIGNNEISPEDIPEPTKCIKWKDEYLFFGAVNYILQTKTGIFAEHSPCLWGISAVPAWTKVYSGLMKMFMAEVLHKFPVIQHFKFGSILPLLPPPKV